MPLQEVAVPQSEAAFNSMLEDYRNAQDPRDTCALKQSLSQAFHGSQAEVNVRHAQEAKSRMLLKKLTLEATVGDQMVISKERMITVEYAEHELVLKEPAIACHQRQVHQQQEKHTAAVSTATADDGNKEGDNNDEELLASLPTPSPPLPFFLDELDNSEPLSAVEDTDSFPSAFYDAVPHASSSRHCL